MIISFRSALLQMPCNSRGKALTNASIIPGSVHRAWICLFTSNFCTSGSGILVGGKVMSRRSRIRAAWFSDQDVGRWGVLMRGCVEGVSKRGL